MPVIKSELIMNSVEDADYVDNIAIKERVFFVSVISLFFKNIEQ